MKYCTFKSIFLRHSKISFDNRDVKLGGQFEKKNSPRRKHANGKYYAYMFDIAFVGRYISQQQTVNIFLIAPEACVHFREIIKISHSITVAILTKPLRINLISSEVFPKLIFNYI